MSHAILSVLMVLETWGTGGTEAFVREMALWLHDRDIAQVSVCLLIGDRASRRSAEQALAGVANEVHVLDAASPWAVFRRLRTLLQHQCPDICHLHLYSHLLPAVLAVRAARAPRLVTTLHMPLWQWSRRHRWAWRFAVSASDWVTGNSSATLRSVGRWPESPRARARLVRPPLAVQARQAPSRRRQGGTKEYFVVAGIGRLSRYKGWDVLLQSMQLLDGDTPGAWQVRLFGEGPERRRLTELANRLGIGGVVRFEGFVPIERLVSEVSKCDVCVLPSQFEGLGMAAIEAMALGVPTITADFEASLDFIEDGVTGHTFPRGDTKALAMLLRWHREHPHATEGIAARGQAFVRERFHPDAVFAPLPEIYGVELVARQG